MIQRGQTKSLGNISKVQEVKPGTYIDDRYQIEDVLGTGGMGRVYRARHLVFDKSFALKILHDAGANDLIAEKRFFNEVRTLHSLQSENVLRVVDAGISREGQYYSVSELLAGRTLKTWMSKTPLTDRNSEFLKAAVGYICGVCLGLQEAHDKGIIHRDLKPSNIFLHQDDRGVTVKIIDFGLAKPVDDSTDKRYFAGTEDYMPPEQKGGRQLDVRSDIYALGVVLYELLTGALPQRQEDPNLQRSKNNKYRIRPPSKINECVPVELDHACLRAIERDPEYRYQSIQEMLRALTFAIGHDEDSEAESELPKQNRPVFAALLMSAILLGGVCGFLLGLVNIPPTAESATMHQLGEQTTENPSVEQKEMMVNGDTPKEKAAVPPIAETKVVRNQSQTRTSQPSRVVIKPAERLAETPSTADLKKNQTIKELLSAGTLAFDNANLLDAEKLFEDALKMDPTSAAAWHGLGKISFEQGNHALAVTRLKTALSYSNNALWRVELGSALHRTGKKDEAMAEWKKVLNADHSKAKQLAASCIAENGFDVQK
ncbi:MAG: protein kinase [Myxococcota bacterium]|nr:protein kinase [Myxococcota bacterium]